MTLKTFIDRPILSGVISVLIVLAGVISLAVLPIEQYPNIATPTIVVSASYTGANAETIQKSVIAPLEEAINGVENMIYMTSTASNMGSATITVYFKQGSDPDMATVNVQNRVSKATGMLPAEVTSAGVSVNKRQTSTVQIFNLYSSDDRYDMNFITNYAQINIVPEILRINGVGDVTTLGYDYSLRIWLKPDVMAQYGLIPSDISAALSEQNIESPTGYFGENSDNTFMYTMKYRGRLEKPEEFGNIVIRSLENGEVLRLKEVADIELGAQGYEMIGEANGHAGTTCMVNQTAGSNASDIVTQIDEVLSRMEPDLPEGIKIARLVNVKDFLDASIWNVVKTLLEAMILVILVVYIFLQSLRSTLIPMVGIVVSLVGTFAALYIAGFSINLLTLFALVLAIGTVVDDAIIVVEAVQAKFEHGYKSPYKATVDAMGGITSAIITSTLVFMAVFIPVSFIGGTSGVFFKQFGITMAVAVGISAVNALTLSPALCALLLRPHTDTNGVEKKPFHMWFRLAFDAAFATMTTKYTSGIRLFIRRKWLAVSVLAGAIIILVLLMMNTKTGLVPEEDQGIIFMNINTAAGSSLSRTKEVIDEVEKSVKAIPEISNYAKNVGYGMMSGQSSSTGMFIIRLKPWDERKKKENSINAVIGRLYGMTADIKDAQVVIFAQPMIIGYGMSDGFEMYVQDKAGGSTEDFNKVTQDFIAAVNQRPEISMAYTTFNINYPQYLVEVDAVKCKRAGIAPSEVLNTLSGYYGGQYVSNFNRFSRIYRVILQASPDTRVDKETLNNIFVRINGEMAPIEQFLTLTKTYGAEYLNRFNMFNAIAVNGSKADGYSSGDAIKAVQEVAAQTLPNGYGYEFSGITREESDSSNNTIIIFAICTLLIYLILCALYESLLIPLAVILAVPVGLAGSFFFTWLLGLENNIYLQTGLIMLIGLLSKTAILITEFASERRKQGMSIVEAATDAAITRFRPILMTALTMIVGLLPLVFSSGVGANGNISLGTGTVGGMLIGTLALLFIVPVLFIVFQTIQEKLSPKKQSENEK